LVFLDVGCTRFFRTLVALGFSGFGFSLVFSGFVDLGFFGFGILFGFFGFGFFSFADTNIYKNEAGMKLFRLRFGFARRKKRLPDE